MYHQSEMCISAVLCRSYIPNVFREKVENVLPSPWWIQWTGKLLAHILAGENIFKECIFVCRLVVTVAAIATIPHIPQGLQHTLIRLQVFITGCTYLIEREKGILLKREE